MKHKPHAPPGNERNWLSQLAGGSFAFFWLLLIFFTSTAQAATPAGTQISNSAAATYLDSSGIERSVTSNTVVTQVQQVAGVTLEQNLSYTVNSGGEVTYPVTLTNTGNGSDSFTLAATSNTGDFTLGSVVFYADSNGDGIADNAIPITSTPNLAPGEVFYFVVSATAPLTATSGQTNTLVVTGTSVFNTAVNDPVTETTTITDNAVINVTKAMDKTSGASPSGPYTVTLTYRNEGNKPASAVKLVDSLPSGMTYVANTGRWSVTGATALTDVSGDLQGTAPTIDYSVTGTTVTAIVNTIAVGQAGTLTFQVNIATNTPPSILPNTANFSYNDGVAVIPSKNTNTVNFEVVATPGVTFDDPPAVTSAPEGGTVPFDNVLTNTGDKTDTFDITIDSNTFPAGSSYMLYQPGGLSPLVDSNGNGTPDTGPVLPGAKYTVVLKVTLPPNVTASGPFSVVKKATSTNDPSKSDTATDTLTTVTQNKVDLTNNSAANGSALGEGITTSGEATPVTTNIATAGTKTTFNLYVNNKGPNTDTYDLAASTDNTFASLVLPTNWTVVFRDGVSGAVITNTGPILANANKLVHAEVSIPAGASNAAALQSIYFRTLSPSSLAQDIKHDAVQLTTSRSLSLIAENTGQVAPGASKVYVHKLTNTGNATEDIALTLASKTGFTSATYIDVNNNGIIDAGDTLVNTSDNANDITGLAPGAIVNLLVKVTADAGTSIGAVDITTLTATATQPMVSGVAAPTPVKVIDTTTVVSGNVVLFKEQALDAACDGYTGEVFTTTPITTGAVPGACILYQITATNNGTADVTNLVISDNTPAYTTYDATPAASSTLGTVTAPSDGTTGTVKATIGTLTPSATAILTFGVKID